MTPNADFSLNHMAPAPCDRVWAAWSEASQLQQWFGPKGCPIFQSDLVLKAGGHYHYGMRTPMGIDLWGKWVFREVTPPTQLVMLAGFSDSHGHSMTRNPMSATWPLEVLATIRFTPQGQQTEIQLLWQPHNASAAEVATFAAGHASMVQGWGGTFDQLDEFLRKNTD